MALRSNVNGYANGASDVASDATYEDPTRALELLKDYPARDGISIEDVRCPSASIHAYANDGYLESSWTRLRLEA